MTTFFSHITVFYFEGRLLSSVTALIIPCPLMYMSKKHDTTVETGGLCALEQRKKINKSKLQQAHRRCKKSRVHLLVQIKLQNFS